MPQSFDSILLHLVVSTKDRKPMLQTGVRERMHGYLAATGRNCGSTVHKVGGVEDHVHIALSLSRTLSVSDLVRELKTQSSKWAKTQLEQQSTFAWQAGYGVFSISRSHLPSLETYIINQAEHHAKKSFKEEFLDLLRKHDLKWDEAYMWD